jgi:hypothetical protein
MRRVLARAAIAFVGLVLMPAAVYAQATITGTVKDTSGAILPGVTVEAASPALIEKVRTAVTDGNGQYRITELRPGAYTVTFSLTGFNTVKRDGINLTGTFTASVDVDLRVGALEETIVVTGEAPMVDVQNARVQRVMDSEKIAELPTGRNMFNLGVLIPGVSISTGGGVASQDVGGALGPETRALVVHGGKTEDQRFLMNGVSLSSMIGGGWGGGAIPNATGVQEMVFDTAAVSAELATGGVRINFIAKEGGNQFHGTLFGNFSNDAMQGGNIGQDLLTRNPLLRNAGSIDKNWDFNPGFGGPLKKDKVWFYFSARTQGAYVFAPGMFYNRNNGNLNAWTYDPDLDRPASNERTWLDGQLRLAWQINQKNKLGITWQQQVNCLCHDAITATTAPEAAQDRRFPVQRPILVDWTSPVTSKLLIEASGIHRVERWGNMHVQTKDDAVDPRAIGVLDQNAFIPSLNTSIANLAYRAGGYNGTFNNSWNNNFHWRFHVSYITGSHAFKVGVNDAYGYHDNTTYVTNPLSYRFNNGVPNSIRMRALPVTQKIHVDQDFGAFAQDKWTRNRMTLSYGLRFDHFANSFPAQELGVSPLTPNRNVSYPETSNLRYNDFTPKSQLAYDLFGNGKTAVKVSLNKYLQGLGTTGTLTGGPNPISNLVLVADRVWSDANGDYVPQCDLTNPVANGECQATIPANFGSVVPGATWDPELLRGWGKRNFNWEFSTGIQHAITPRVSLDVSFFRRWYGNFLVTDNLAVGPEDYSTFNIVVPNDPRLSTAGTTIGGFKNITAEAATRPQNNFVTRAQNYGKQTEHWNGVDVNVNARLASGVFLQGGTGTGRTTTNNCEVLERVPEAGFATLLAGATQSAGVHPYCNVVGAWITQVKGAASYTVPKANVLVAATYQNLIGPEAGANFVVSSTGATSQYITGLNRPLAGTANVTGALFAPGRQFEGRLNQLDLRFSKLLRFGPQRVMAGIDVYNVFNSATVIALNNGYNLSTAGAFPAQYPVPTSILQARFIKFSAQLDF